MSDQLCTESCNAVVLERMLEPVGKTKLRELLSNFLSRRRGWGGCLRNLNTEHRVNIQFLCGAQTLVFPRNPEVVSTGSPIAINVFQIMCGQIMLRYSRQRKPKGLQEESA